MVVYGSEYQFISCVLQITMGMCNMGSGLYRVEDEQISVICIIFYGLQMYSLIRKRWTLTSYTTLKPRCEDDLSSPRQGNRTVKGMIFILNLNPISLSF